MGKRTSSAPGTFSWVDLATTDAAAAKLFYGDLFGWESDDGSATWRLDGDAACGLAERAGDMGVRPNWTSYVTVTDADAAVARAKELGGGPIGSPFDVGDAGRMAVLKDPQGAEFAVWQPRAWIGAERVNDIGCLCMNELVTTDVDAARSFYAGLFGWRTDIVHTGPDGPLVVLAYNGETLNASFLAGETGEASHWRPCFTVESTEAAVERVRELGGRVLVEHEDNVDGSIAVALDPQGARFALYAGEVDP